MKSSNISGGVKGVMAAGISLKSEISASGGSVSQ
jgi:hypothetical protein